MQDAVLVAMDVVRRDVVAACRQGSSLLQAHQVGGWMQAHQWAAGLRTPLAAHTTTAHPSHDGPPHAQELLHRVLEFCEMDRSEQVTPRGFPSSWNTSTSIAGGR